MAFAAINGERSIAMFDTPRPSVWRQPD